MAKVRGASLGDEAVKLGFWVVVARIMKVAADSRSDSFEEISEPVRAEISKRYQGDLPALLSQAAHAQAQVVARTSEVSVTAAAYERSRAEIAGLNTLESKPGSAAWPPGAQTVMARFGGGAWSAALAELGLPGAGQGRALGSGRLKQVDFEDAIGAFVKDCAAKGISATYAEYGRWVKGEQEAGRPRPSGSTVRQRYRSWSAALELRGSEV